MALNIENGILEEHPTADTWLSSLIAAWLERCDALQTIEDALPQQYSSPSASIATPPRAISRLSISSRSTVPARKRRRPMDSDRGSTRSGSTATTRTTALSLNQSSAVLPPPKPKSSRARSSSPNRKTLKELAHATPNVKIFQPDRSIVQPRLVAELRSRLTRRLCRPYIPLSLKENFRNADPDHFESYEHLFDQDITVSHTEWSWEMIQELYTKAQRTNDRHLDETSWLNLAQTILEHGVRGPTSMLNVYPIQTQNIESSLLPIHSNQPVGKRADLALGFDPQNAVIGNIVTRTNDAYSTTALSQMSDADTMMIPLAGGIEVKERGGDYNEAISQLGVWCAAGFKRLEGLRKLARDQSSTADDGGTVVTEAAQDVAQHAAQDVAQYAAHGGGNSKVEEQILPPLVGWTIVGHDWKLHISYQNESGNVIVLGPWRHLMFGSGSHLEIWTLLTLIQEVRLWLEGVYWVWLKKNVLDHLV